MSLRPSVRQIVIYCGVRLYLRNYRLLRRLGLRISLIYYLARNLLIANELDLKNVFLNGDLSENVYMSQPSGLDISGKSDNGDIIDCVNIYKQISFDNPSIKRSQLNLNLEKQRKRDNSFPKNKLVQGWHRNGECPFQTVPILRPLRRQTSSFQPLLASKSVDITKREHAVVWNQQGAYYGASAKFSVWNPRTEENDFSLTQLWLVDEVHSSKLNSIEAGWTVHPNLFGDNKTRFFIYWTTDYYNKTGCYNLECSGFVQTSRTFALGSSLSLPISKYDKKSSELKASVFKNKESGDWLLELDNEVIGYWPYELFDGLNASASRISWGGEVYKSNSSSKRHTTTQMGSGHFPKEGYLRASHIRNLLVMNELNKWTSPGWTSLTKVITKPQCYSLKIPNTLQRKLGWGVHVYYGGPGFSPQCP
ncbi:uncharacterized protein LOC124928204 [Impatiens glandulifera]|uniref:uncharacterized protein LOC124928204 n=1 Tax=Impatiens glandulifera TaxID=253017 RepID=UPI001FB0F275|nr:uncharacterized protein LOC124928204 [Impatiens glandulifera]